VKFLEIIGLTTVNHGLGVEHELDWALRIRFNFDVVTVPSACALELP